MELQNAGRWDATGEILATLGSATRARRRDGARHRARTRCTSTTTSVASAVSVPVLDVRDAVANEVLALGRSRHRPPRHEVPGRARLLHRATGAPRGRGVASHRDPQVERLQSIIYDELTKGVVLEVSRAYLREVATSLLERGADVVGLCCTEFGLLMGEDEPFAVIDSTRAHVRALLAATG